MIVFIRTIVCLLVIALGGVIAVELQDAILGCLISSGGVLAIALPLMDNNRKRYDYER
jgi:hypothetical protein